MLLDADGWRVVLVVAGRWPWLRGSWTSGDSVRQRLQALHVSCRPVDLSKNGVQLFFLPPNSTFHEDIWGYTLWLFNIAMEHHHF